MVLHLSLIIIDLRNIGTSFVPYTAALLLVDGGELLNFFRVKCSCTVRKQATENKR